MLVMPNEVALQCVMEGMSVTIGSIPFGGSESNQHSLLLVVHSGMVLQLVIM